MMIATSTSGLWLVDLMAVEKFLGSTRRGSKVKHPKYFVSALNRPKVISILLMVCSLTCAFLSMVGARRRKGARLSERQIAFPKDSRHKEAQSTCEQYLCPGPGKGQKERERSSKNSRTAPSGVSYRKLIE